MNKITYRPSIPSSTIADIVADKFVETLDLFQLSQTQSLILHAIRNVAQIRALQEAI